MNVSTDPRIVKQLLSAQFFNPVGVISGGETASFEDSGIFGMLLGQLLSDSMVSQSAQSAPVTEPAVGKAVPRLLGSSAFMAPSAGTALVGSLQTASSNRKNAYDALIASAAEKYGVDFALIKGVIQTESGFKADAVSPAGAKGLMQLMDATAKGLGVTNSWDPAQNIDGGTRFLSYLLRKYDGNVYSALAAYNAGPGRVDRLGLTNDDLVRARYSELPEETQRYIPKVLQAAMQWSLSM